MLKNLITKIPKTELDFHIQEIEPDHWKTIIIHRPTQEKNEIKGFVHTSTIIQSLLRFMYMTHNLILSLPLF